MNLYATRSQVYEKHLSDAGHANDCTVQPQHPITYIYMIPANFFNL